MDERPIFTKSAEYQLGNRVVLREEGVEFCPGLGFDEDFCPAFGRLVLSCLLGFAVDFLPGILFERAFGLLTISPALGLLTASTFCGWLMISPGLTLVTITPGRGLAIWRDLNVPRPVVGFLVVPLVAFDASFLFVVSKLIVLQVVVLVVDTVVAIFVVFLVVV